MKTPNTLRLGFSARHLALGGLLAALLCLLPALTRAETAVQAWVQRYNGPGNSADCAIAVAVDGSNNVIVMGQSVGSGSHYDYATIKYSSAGVPLWTNRYNGPGNNYDYAAAVAVDGSNNVIVAGESDNVTDRDYATIKYSSAGEPLWTNRYNGPGNDYDCATAVAVDGDNNVIVTGDSASTNVYPYNYDYVTIKYSSAGVPLWINRYNGLGNDNDTAIALAVDGSNEVIVTGTSYPVGYTTIKYSNAGVPLWTNWGLAGDPTAMAVDGSNNVIVTGCSSGSGGWSDYGTIKYSAAGVPLWTNIYDGPGNGDDSAQAVAVDGSNNVIVTGDSDISAGSYSYDSVTIKYSSAGVPLWTNRYNGPGNSDDYARGVAVDGSNNVIVTGKSRGSGGDSHYVTIKYSSAGVPLWTNRYNGPANSNDIARAVAVDRSGNVIVTGISGGTGGDPADFATIKYICVPSPAMTGLQLTNGTFQLRVDEVLQPGTLVIEASTNLTGWSPLFTNTTPTNVLFYTDPDAGNYLRRFYRAFQFP